MRGRVQRHNQRVKKLLVVLLAAGSALAQISPRPVDAIVPVAGSTHGQSGANFKTELQLHNPTEIQMTGWIVFQPAGQLTRYELAPHATLSFGDVVAELGATGLGSLDILVDHGTLPTAVARAYDDQPRGTTGVSLPVIPGSDALGRGDVVTLITARDLVRYRFNIGVRALDAGVTLDITVYSPSGAKRHTRSLTLEPNNFLQQPGASFAGIALDPDDAIEVEIASGTAIVYATTVDNQTNDSSFQLAK